MPISDRENYLRTVAMTEPEWMPCTVSISGASWDQLRGDLEGVLVRHPVLFPDFEQGKRDYAHQDFGPGHHAGERLTDAWGCGWESAMDGIQGVVIEHPLDLIGLV